MADNLVVVSKLKNYIRSKAEMSTSANLAPALSDIIRNACDKAIEHAKNDRRKTVMDRDFDGAQGQAETLVVVSKLKNYIRSSAEMSTAAKAAPALSGIVSQLCDQAMENAKSAKRKTVMDKDLPSLQ